MRTESATTSNDVVRPPFGGRTMVCMEMVIERGQARCPRCVAVADYFFVELSSNLLRYEVDCGQCGEVYREEHGPVPPTFGVLATTDEWQPETPAVPMRERVQAWADSGRRRITALGTAVAAALNRRTAPPESLKLT